MKLIPVAILAICLSACAAARADIILSHGVTYTQNFNTLAFTPDGGTATTLPNSPNGWAFVEANNNANTTYTIANGNNAAGDTYSFGTTGSTERAFGTLGQNSPTRNQTIGARFASNGANLKPFTKAIITFTGEQWRLGATGRLDRLDFQVSTNATSLSTGTWVDFNSLDFIAPKTTGTVGALDGNASANRVTLTAKIALPTAVSPGSAFWIRWNGFDASGAEDGLAIDDFSIKAIPEPSSALALGGAFLAGMGWVVARRKRLRKKGISIDSP